MLDILAGIVTLSVLTLLAIMIAMLIYATLFEDRKLPHPFTPLGRARWRKRRVLQARMVELLDRGYDESEAKRQAERALEREARDTTKVFVEAGLETAVGGR